MRQRVAAAALALFIVAPTVQAHAQAWPQRPVKLLLTLGPGSGADIGARLVADKLTTKWGQPVVVENRPGGDGFVYYLEADRARPDFTLKCDPSRR